MACFFTTLTSSIHTTWPYHLSSVYIELFVEFFSADCESRPCFQHVRSLFSAFGEHLKRSVMVRRHTRLRSAVRRSSLYG